MTELQEITAGKSFAELLVELYHQLLNGEDFGGTICSHIYQVAKSKANEAQETILKDFAENWEKRELRFTYYNRRNRDETIPLDEQMEFWMDCVGIDIEAGNRIETVGLDDQCPPPEPGEVAEEYLTGEVLGTRNKHIVVKGDNGEIKEIKAGRLRVL